MLSGPLLTASLQGSVSTAFLAGCLLCSMRARFLCCCGLAAPHCGDASSLAWCSAIPPHLAQKMMMAGPSSMSAAIKTCSAAWSLILAMDPRTLAHGSKLPRSLEAVSLQQSMHRQRPLCVQYHRCSCTTRGITCRSRGIQAYLILVSLWDGKPARTSADFLSILIALADATLCSSCSCSGTWCDLSTSFQ